MSNPFLIGFGIRPNEYIPLLSQLREVELAFNETDSRKRAYVIVGVRGSGKTVLMNEISTKIGNEWIVINLSSQEDLMASLTAQLYSDRSMHKHFLKSRIDLSFMGIGLHIEKSIPAFDSQTAIRQMLQEVAKQNKKVLVKIDEVANTAGMRSFASAFQIFIGEDLPIFLLMAGIPDNVKGLTDEERSTFLLRTPRIEMSPLNISSIKRSYAKNLKVSEDTALALAKLTKGYAFAYQVLGSVCWGKKIDPEDESFEEIMDEYDQNLQEYSYFKIWEEMSLTDRRISKVIAKDILGGSGESCKVKTVREQLRMTPGEFNVYRNRLMKKGVIDGSVYGELSFALPRFEQFAIDQL